MGGGRRTLEDRAEREEVGVGEDEGGVEDLGGEEKRVSFNFYLRQ